MGARDRYERRRQRRQRWSGLSRLGAASLVLLGLILGLAAGLYYAWVISPVIFTDASPARLGRIYQESYIYMVSQSYFQDRNWPRAQARLRALEDPELAETVGALLQTYLRQGEPEARVRPLAILAEQLGVSDPAVALFVTRAVPPTPLPAPTVANPTATPTLLPTPTATSLPSPTPPPPPTPSPSAVPSPTAVPVFRLLSQERVCDPALPAPRIEVVTLTADLEPLPGAEVLISWDQGGDHFFTGFKPELGDGYGDFTMAPEVSYSVVLAEGSPVVSGLRVELCDPADGGLSGGWRLTFQNTIVVFATPSPEPSATR